MIRRVRCIVCILVCTLLLGGCYNYRDMNRLLFSTLAIFHRDQDGKIVVFGEFFKAYRGEGEKAGMEKRIVLQGKGETIFEAISWIRLSTSFPMDYAENKALVLSMDLIKSGVEEVLDSTDRDQKPSWRQYLFAFEGKPEELMNLKMEDEQFNGLFLNNMMVAQEKNLSTTELQFYEMLDNLDMGSQINVIPILKVETHNAKQENSGGTGDGEKKGDSQTEIEDPEGQQDTSQSKGSADDSGGSKTEKEESSGSTKDTPQEKTGEGKDGQEQAGGKSGEQDNKQSGSESGAQDSKQSGSESGAQGSKQSGSESSSQSGSKSSGSGSESTINQLIMPHLLLDGAVVLVGNNLAASISKPQLEAYNFFKDNVGEGIVITNNPEYDGKQASFSVLSSKPKPTIKYENGRIKLNYRIKIKLVLMEAEQGITLSDHGIEEKLMKNAKTSIEKRMMDFYNEMKEKKIDILDIKRLLYIKYPALVVDDPLSITDLTVETAITLDDEGKIRDARY